MNKKLKIEEKQTDNSFLQLAKKIDFGSLKNLNSSHSRTPKKNEEL